MGFSAVRLCDVVEPVERSIKTEKSLKQHSSLPLLSVTSEGEAIPRAKKLKRKVKMTELTTKYPVLFMVNTGDIVLSRIDIVNGAVAIVLQDLNGYLVSREFIVLTIKEIIDPYYAWVYLRSNYVGEYVRGMMKGVTSRHRVTRFGFSYIERFLSSHGVSIHVVDGEVRKEPHKELVEDLIAVVTSFAGHLYGMRSHKKRRVVETLERSLRDD